MRLRYTLQGAAELDRILSYIAERSPQGARRVQARIQLVISLLSNHPLAGHRTSNGRLRRITVFPYPYLIFYQAIDDEIVIHGVRHSARRPSSMPGSAKS